MCQQCRLVVDLEVQPWLWEPGNACCEKDEKSNNNDCTTNTHTIKKFGANNKNFIDEVVKAHNEYRRNHQVSPLRHAADLSKQAQQWAEHLAITNSFQHSKSRGNVGENIAMKWSSRPESYTGHEVTEQWYSEIKLHVFGVEPKSLASGHFTQLVWKGSREIGVGRAQSSDGKILVVANYRPAGNVVGRFCDNVPPPSGGKVHLLNPRGTSKWEPNSKTTPSPSYRPRMDRFSSKTSESRSVRTFTETSGSGPNKVTKTIVEETITKSDGTKVTNRKETVTTGDSGGDGATRMALMEDRGREKEKDKGKKGGAFGDMPDIGDLRLEKKSDDLFKKGKRSSSSSSSSDSSRERSKKPQTIKEFVNDVVKVHNEYRKKHGVDKLKHSKELDKFAQEWAEHLAKNNTFQHSDCKLKGERLGENIACKWTSDGRDYTGQEVCDQWYSEIKKHNFDSEPRSTGTGHFTQMVWKGSKEIGIGKAKDSKGKVIVVASYKPVGNVVGTFKDNVSRPK